MKDQRGASYLAVTGIWMAWQRDEIFHLAAQLAVAWDARLRCYSHTAPVKSSIGSGRVSTH